MTPPPVILDTDRLRLRELVAEDAPFILALVNEPGWLRFIGDRGIHTLDAARDYIETGPRTSYARNGYGLWAVEERPTGIPVGICGLLLREGLYGADLGFAYLAPYEGRGYATEAGRAVVRYAHEALGFTRLLAITQPDHAASGRVLIKCGFTLWGMIRLPSLDAPQRLYEWTAAPSEVG